MDPIVGKPGWQTTEFWLSVASVLSTILIAWKGTDYGIAANAQQVALIAPAIIAAAYALARSALKSSTHKAIAAQNMAVIATETDTHVAA